MSQEWVSATDHRWEMRCNIRGCQTRTPSTVEAMPLEYFADRGWFIARVFGDVCPGCVEQGRVMSTDVPLFPTKWERQQEYRREMARQAQKAQAKSPGRAPRS